MKRICSVLLTTILTAAMLLGIMLPAGAAVDENGYIDVPAEEINVASLTLSDIKAVIGEDVSVYPFDDGSAFIDIDFDCGAPLYITLTDGTKLEGEDAYTYLAEYDQYFGFNPLPDERWPEQLPAPGTSQRFVCNVCTDLYVVFTVYFVASAEDEIPAELEAHTCYPGTPFNYEDLRDYGEETSAPEDAESETPAGAAVDENDYIDVPAEEINVASLTLSDIKAVIGEDVYVYPFDDGSTTIHIDFDCGAPLYITLTDGTKLEGVDAYTYLGEHDQYFIFNPLPDERWPKELPAPGTSQRFVCSVCTDLEVVFTVYFVASAEDEIPNALEAHTCYAKAPFTDVKDSAYYNDAMLWAINSNPQVTNGTSATTFSPDDTSTRAEVVTFLWRTQGCPEPTNTDNPFTDVKEDAYYYQAVLWAAENGITAGTSATTFSPDEGCTRAQVVTFLWRMEYAPVPASPDNPFTDVTGSYYYTAVLWAMENKITVGTSATTFSPDATCTRGQIVTFLCREFAE